MELAEGLKTVNTGVSTGKYVTKSPVNGEEYCESGELSGEECKRSYCCHWNTWEKGEASNWGRGRCWSSIGRRTCVVEDDSDDPDVDQSSGGSKPSDPTHRGKNATFTYGVTTRNVGWGQQAHLAGNHNCMAVLSTGSSGGSCTGKKDPMYGKFDAREGETQKFDLEGTPVYDNIRCVQVWSKKDYWMELGRRRVAIDEVRADTSFRGYDPLCDYMLAENVGTELDFADEEAVEEMKERLYQDCEDSYHDAERQK